MSDENVTTEQSTEEQKPQAVDLETYERTKNDMHKFKRQYSDLAKEKEELMQKLTQLEENQLKNSENYKELWEKEREQKSTWESKFKSFSQQVIEDKKMAAIKENALKAGIDSEFLDVLEAFDTSDVLVETTSSGGFVVNGADTWIDALKSTKPKMFKQRVDPSINNKSNNSNELRDKTYSPSEVLQLQKENPEKYRDIITNKKHLIKR